MDGGGYIYSLGLVFLSYGILKVLLVVSLLFLIPKPVQHELGKLPGMNLLITGDTTLAGKGGEIVLALFGLFSIAHGLALMGYLPHTAINVFESKWFQYMVYTTFGIALMVFYSLVLYTDLPIPKRQESRKLYWTYAYIGGLSFLIVPILWEAFIRLSPYMSQLSLRGQLAWLTAFLMFMGILAYVIMMNLPKNV